MIRWHPWEGGGLELPYLFQRKMRKEKNKRRRKVRKIFVLARGGLVDTPPCTDATRPIEALRFRIASYF